MSAAELFHSVFFFDDVRESVLSYWINNAYNNLQKDSHGCADMYPMVVKYLIQKIVSADVVLSINNDGFNFFSCDALFIPLSLLCSNQSVLANKLIENQIEGQTEVVSLYFYSKIIPIEEKFHNFVKTRTLFWLNVNMAFVTASGLDLSLFHAGIIEEYITTCQNGFFRESLRRISSLIQRIAVQTE